MLVASFERLVVVRENILARHYKELIVWQQGMELVTHVYRVTAGFPRDEKFGLVSQLRRAAVSVPSNIAEGQGRLTVGEFRQFLGHARGSLFEVETQVIIARNLNMIDDAEVDQLQERVGNVGRLLNGLIRSIRSDLPSAPAEDAGQLLECTYN